MENNKEIKEELQNISLKLADEGLSFEERCELKGREHNLTMKLNGAKPTDSYIECIGCGS